MGFRMKSMVAECDILGAAREVSFNDGQVIISGVDVSEFMPLVAQLAGVGALANAPATAPAAVSVERVEQAKDNKVLGKRRTKTARKTAPKKTSNGKGTAASPRVAEPAPDDEPTKAVADSGDGSAASPRAARAPVEPEVDATDEELDQELRADMDDKYPLPDGWERREVDGVRKNIHIACGKSVCVCDEDKAEAEPPSSDLPDGWEECMLDGTMQVIHTACGSAQCLCHLTAESKEEAAGKEEEAKPVEESDVAAIEDGEDPLCDDLRKAKRLVNVVAKIVSAGITDADEIMDRCHHYRAHVPLLAKIPKGSFDTRVARSIEINSPASA